MVWEMSADAGAVVWCGVGKTTQKSKKISSLVRKEGRGLFSIFSFSFSFSFFSLINWNNREKRKKKKEKLKCFLCSVKSVVYGE